MARNIIENDDDFDGIDEVLREESAPQESDGLFDEMSADEDSMVNVHRVGVGRKAPFLFASHPRDYTLGAMLEKLRDEYGGGEFILKLTKKGVYQKQRMVAVEKAIDKPAAPVATVAPQGDNMILTLLMQQAERAEASAVRMQESMNNMLLAIVNRKEPQAKESSLTELVTSLAAMKQLEPKPEKNAGDMEMFLKGVEFGKDMAGGSEPEGILQSAVKSFAPMLEKMATMQAQQPQQQPRRMPPQQRAPLPAGVTAIQAQPAPSQVTEAPPDATLYNAMLTMLAKAAFSNADPEVYANVFLDQAPELLPMIKDDAQYGMMIASLGDVGAQVTDWLDNWRDMCIELSDVSSSEPQDQPDISVPVGQFNLGDSEGGDLD